MKATVSEILLRLVLYMVRIWFIRQEMQVGFEQAIKTVKTSVKVYFTLVKCNKIHF